MIHLYKDIMISYDMGLSNQAGRQSVIHEKDQQGHIVLVMDDIVKYNRVTELCDSVKYHSKLMSYYGFDPKTGKWDSRLFPATQNDAQLDGIQKDIERYNNALRDYNKYAEHLAQELQIDIYEEMTKGHSIVFRPP
jgi:hypothetical protein